MKRTALRPWLGMALRVFIGGLFIVAGALKLADPFALADSIASFRVLPVVLIVPLALALPPLEILAGAMLASGRGARPAALALGLLCMVFLLALGQAWWRGLSVDCGCFGDLLPGGTVTATGRNLFLLAGLAWLYTEALSGQEPSSNSSAAAAKRSVRCT